MNMVRTQLAIDAYLGNEFPLTFILRINRENRE